MKHVNMKDIQFSLNKFSINARTLVDHDNATIKNLFLNKGQRIPDHQVPLDVTFFILEGTGKITIGDETESIKPNDVILCPPNTKMSVQADEDSTLSFLNIKTPGLKA